MLVQSPIPNPQSQIRNPQSAIRKLTVAMWVLMLPSSVEAQPQFPNARQPGSVSRSPDVRQTTRDFRFEQPQTQAARNPDAGAKQITKPSRTISPPDDPKTEKTRSPGSFGTTLVALSFVILLILVAARLWSKHGPAVSEGLPPEALQVLGKRQLDQRQTVYLARLGSRILVLGSSANGLQTLCEITDPIEVDFLAGVCRRDDSHTTVAQTFRTLFKKQTGRLSRDTTSPPEPRLENIRG